MNKLTLYMRYAARSFMRGRSRSLFGAFCVAVGVASVVALGLVSANFERATTGDARQLNRGDLSVSPPGLGLTLKQYHLFATLKSRGEVADFTPRLQDDAVLRNPGQSSSSTVGSIVGVDSRVFPYYDTITADSPSGVPLAQLLARPNAAVVSHDTIDSLHLRVGDRITINSRRGFNHVYTIAGVVPDSAVDPFFGAGFWNDFAMVDNASVSSFFHSMDVGATTVYVKTRDAAQAARAKAELTRSLGDLVTVKTVADVAKQQKDSAAAFDKFFRIMGLVAVMIGGIGIINTMLVAARRRLREIAVLKTVGMKGRQVLVVFTLESLILGVAGSGLGLLGGVATSLAVNRVTENLSGNPIPWSFEAGPALAGTLVGIVATVLFGYLPTVQASRVRPIVALRGEAAVAVRAGRMRALFHDVRRHPVASAGRALRRLPMGIVRLPRRPGLRTFVLVLVLAALMGYLGVLYSGFTSGGQTVVIGALAGVGTLVAASLITQLFVFAVWLISKFPSAGRLSLRMAFRSMGTQKRRLGSTILALCVGMLAVGSIAILAQNMKSFATEGMGRQLGYNVAIQSPHDGRTIAGINREIARLPGIERTNTGDVSNSATLVSVDGENANAVLQEKRRAKKIGADMVSQLSYEMQGLEGRNPGAVSSSLSMAAGRNLNGSDRGTSHIVVSEDLKQIGVRLGSRLDFRDGSRLVRFTVIGLLASSDPTLFSTNMADSTYLHRSGLAAPTPSHFQVVYLTVQSDKLSADLSALRRNVRGAMVLDLSNFSVMINKAIDKLALFPEIIGALALFAGVVIIANTVALAMLERRREIGVMKAVGARRRTVLQFLLVENAIVGLLGGLAGTGLAMIATALVDAQLLKIGASYDWATVAGLIGLGVVLATGASSLTALPASGEKPMTVLRYE